MYYMHDHTNFQRFNSGQLGMSLVFFFFFWAEIMQIHLCYIHDHTNLSMLHVQKSSNPKLSGLCSNLCYKDEHRDLIETFTTFEFY